MDVIRVFEKQQFAAEKMKKVGLFDTQNLFCDLYCLEPGQEQKSHTHAHEDKVYFVLEGKVRVRIGGDEKELSANMLTLAPAGSEHGVANHTNTRSTLLVFMAPKPQH
ncbi:MAG: cupin domain-containing protein [Candidatus Tectomicrobia bacterium]|nr:cupin domain-containing protein [Candidatus Tectomicrobia bacterium]